MEILQSNQKLEIARDIRDKSSSQFQPNRRIDNQMKLEASQLWIQNLKTICLQIT
jgi:hypothetical protein